MYNPRLLEVADSEYLDYELHALLRPELNGDTRPTVLDEMIEACGVSLGKLPRAFAIDRNLDPSC
jgi:hypothetical protein